MMAVLGVRQWYFHETPEFHRMIRVQFGGGLVAPPRDVKNSRLGATALPHVPNRASTTRGFHVWFPLIMHP